MKQSQPGILLFLNWLPALEKLPRQDVGELVIAALRYAETGIVPELSGTLTVLWELLQGDIDRNFEKYQEKSRQSRFAAYCRESKAKGATPLPFDEWAASVDIIRHRAISSDIVSNQLNKTTNKATNKTKPSNIYCPAEPNSAQKVQPNKKDLFAKQCSEVVEYLNTTLGTRYKKSSEATCKHIRARLKEGATIEDFKTVIDKKVTEWKGTDMEKFLRPETLFGTKFESYLNQQQTTVTQKDSKNVQSLPTDEREYIMAGVQRC